jgi:hypothetical protein
MRADEAQAGGRLLKDQGRTFGVQSLREWRIVAIGGQLASCRDGGAAVALEQKSTAFGDAFVTWIIPRA